MAQAQSKSKAVTGKKAATSNKITPQTSTGEKTTAVTPEQRYQMIAEAAYYIAEKRGFVGGDVARDWLEAEAQIDRLLGQSSAAGEEGADAKRYFQQKLEAQLKEWDAKLDELKAMAKQAKAETRAEIDQQIQALAERRTAIQEKLSQLRQRTEEAWEDLKTGAETILDEMHETFERVLAHFK